MSGHYSRRDAIGLGLGWGVGVGLGLGTVGGLRASSAASRLQSAEKAGDVRPPRKRALRVAHITDTHIEPELRAADGVAACLAHIREKKFARAEVGGGGGGVLSADKVDLILHGGDAVFDTCDVGEARAKEVWGLWSKVMKDGWDGPLKYAVGNHDCWGMNKKVSGTSGEEGLWGKRWALDVMGIKGVARADTKTSGAYYSFDQNGWHFVVLDSVRIIENGYYGGLDDEQFDWLKGDLLLNKMHPTLVLSHIPILTVTVLDRGINDKMERVVHPALMCTDFERIKKLFLENPQVKVCLSGHMHLLDRVEYNGVTYLCNGAVCGNWWKGKHKDCGEGYAIVDLFGDGSFENQYVGYGWKAGEG